MTSTFNPETFMNTSTTEAGSTKYTPVPEEDYPASIKEVKPREAKGRGILDINWEIVDERAKAATGMESSVVRQSIFLDLTESGGLDMGKGKNIPLNKLREAVNQNAPGKTWQPGMLLGQVALVKVTHRLVDDNIYADVKGVTKL